jgi:16S rRNA G966 N2-methylase RsmD
LSRLEAAARAQFYPTPDRVATAITRYLAAARTRSGEVIRLLDPCAGEGVAAAEVAGALGAESYGIELNAERAREAETRLGRVLCHTALWGVKLANSAFSVLLLNPPYDYDDEKKRLEHHFLTAMTRTLVPGGVLALLIPQRRLALSARYLAAHYEQVTCYRFPDPEYDAFGQVVLFGVRRRSPGADLNLQVRIEGWSSSSLPQLPDVPGPSERTYQVPAVPGGEVLFGTTAFDPQHAATEAKARGVWAGKLLREELWPGEERPVRPLMPLRKGHLAMLIAAGFLNNMVLEQEGERLLVKGRAYKESVEIPTEEKGKKIEREVVRTRVTTLDLSSGEIRDIDQGTGLSEFIERYQDAITEAVRRSYPPVYTAQNRDSWGIDLSGLKRRPLGAQADAIRAAVVSLQRNPGTIICGVMGTGKTYMGIAAAWLYGARRVIVICPPHLVKKWKEEVEATVPGARATIVRTISDIDRTLATSGGTRYVILSRESAKLSCRWRPAFVTRRQRIYVPGGAYIENVVCCPACHKPVLDKEGVPLNRFDLEKKKLCCASIVGPEGAQSVCGEPLWQADAAPPKTGHGTFSFGSGGPAVPPSGPGEGPRRYALADYIAEQCSGAFNLCIIDEMHEMKGKGTAQGLAAAAVAEACPKVLALSGTLFGGYSSSVFYLLYRFSRNIRGEFGYHDEPNWISRYGIVERITRTDDDPTEYGSYSKRRGYRTTTVERPGISPAVLLHLIDHTVFVQLEDVAANLPPFEEVVELVEMTPEQKVAYDRFAGDLRAAMMEALARGSRKLLGVYVQALLAYPDNPVLGETVHDPDTGVLVASAPALPGDVLYPKEERTVQRCLEERDAGRRVLLYVTHTEKRDVTPRLSKILEDAGLRVRVLKANTVKPEDRMDWLSARVAEGVDVIICHPKLVQTGLDLIAFPELRWQEVEFSVYVTRQASRRSWRIGQTKRVRNGFSVYTGTLQHDALALIACKMKASLMVEGNIGDEGLSALNSGGGDDLMVALAKKLSKQEASDAGSLEALFAEAKRIEDAASGMIGDADWGEEPVVVPEPVPVGPRLAPAELATLWAEVLLGEEPRPEREPEEKGVRTLAFGEFVGSSQARRKGKKATEAQARLFDLIG